MNERLKFIAWLLEGENMAPLRREFGISRVTGYGGIDPSGAVRRFAFSDECALPQLARRSLSLAIRYLRLSKETAEEDSVENP